MSEELPVKNQKSKRKTIPTWLPVCGVLLIVFAIILVLFFLLRGETTTTGDWSNTESVKSLTCEGDGIDYPIFTYDNSTHKNMKINAIFNSTDKVQTISLKYTLYYDNEKAIGASEASNHAAMNISFGKNGLNPDSFNASYATLPDSMKMTLYAPDGKINGTTAKYFLLDASDSYTSKNMQDVYESKGLTCVLDEK